MRELTRFKRWAERNRAGRGLLCHFYEAEGKQKQYYTKLDYAYFNLFTDSPNWVIKGTIGHGIRSKRGKPSQVPCFNCYQVDEEFYKALKTCCKEPYTKYGVGIIFSKRRIKNLFGEDNVVDLKNGILGKIARLQVNAGNTTLAVSLVRSYGLSIIAK